MDGQYLYCSGNSEECSCKSRKVRAVYVDQYGFWHATTKTTKKASITCDAESLAIESDTEL